MNKYQIIEIGEYIAILLVLVGSGIAIITGTIIYAIVPMALALIFNLFTYSQFKKYLNQQFYKKHSEFNQQITEEIQSIKTAISAINNQDNNDIIEKQINLLINKIDLLQNNKETNDNTEIINHCQKLQDTLDSLVYRMLADGTLSSRKPRLPETGISNIITTYNKNIKKMNIDN